MKHRRITYSQRPNHAARAAHARGEREFKTYDTSLIRPKKSKAPFIALAVGIIVVIAAAVIVAVSCSPSNPNMLEEGQEATVEIASGSSAQTIAETLYGAGVIASEEGFLREVSSRDAGSSLKPGTYTFVGGVTPEEVVTQLVAGPGMSEDALVIPEGYTVDDIARAVEEAYEGSITADQFIEAAHSADRFVENYPFVAEAYEGDLEGFLFPKTYELIPGATADEVITQMLDQYETEIASLDFSYPESLGYSPYETLILASIVEKESDSSTRSRVAAVFWNRLTNLGDPTFGMLGSDATTAYEIGEEPLDYDWTSDSPYNTRTHVGLCPTPICSPSLASLEAVCHPEQNFGDYYFFSFWPNEQGELEYFFDKTYEEHQATIAEHA